MNKRYIQKIEPKAENAETAPELQRPELGQPISKESAEPTERKTTNIEEIAIVNEAINQFNERLEDLEQDITLVLKSPEDTYVEKITSGNNNSEFLRIATSQKLVMAYNKMINSYLTSRASQNSKDIMKSNMNQLSKEIDKTTYLIEQLNNRIVENTFSIKSYGEFMNGEDGDLQHAEATKLNNFFKRFFYGMVKTESVLDSIQNDFFTNTYRLLTPESINNSLNNTIKEYTLKDNGAYAFIFTDLINKSQLEESVSTVASLKKVNKKKETTKNLSKIEQDKNEITKIRFFINQKDRIMRNLGKFKDKFLKSLVDLRDAFPEDTVGVSEKNKLLDVLGNALEGYYLVKNFINTEGKKRSKGDLEKDVRDNTDFVSLKDNQRQSKGARKEFLKVIDRLGKNVVEDFDNMAKFTDETSSRGPALIDQIKKANPVLKDF